MNEMISILMPVKNAEKYLEACLDSILKQTEKHWELVAVDDDSSDNSYAILKKYADSDNRIHVLKNIGKGIIEALRLAYGNSKGTLITRMDADDKMSSDKLVLMSSTLKRKGEGFLAVGLVEYFSETSLGDGYRKYADWLNELTLAENNFSEIYKECVIPSPCWMVWKNDFEKCGAFNSEVYPEDYDLCFRFYKYNLKIISIKNTLHYWRDYGERTSRNDPNYADNRFFELKINYFLQLEFNSEKNNLFLWGAGKKGKNIAKLLINENIKFNWICDNGKKIGKDIYDIKMKHFNTLLNQKKSKVIVSVSSPIEKKEIEDWLNKNEISSYYFFG